jgi:hypothetical protein
MVILLSCKVRTNPLSSSWTEDVLFPHGFAVDPRFCFFCFSKIIRWKLSCIHIEGRISCTWKKDSQIPIPTIGVERDFNHRNVGQSALRRPVRWLTVRHVSLCGPLAGKYGILPVLSYRFCCTFSRCLHMYCMYCTDDGGRILGT